MGMPTLYVTGHLGQLYFLPIVGQEMGTGQWAVAGLCGWKSNHWSGLHGSCNIITDFVI